MTTATKPARKPGARSLATTERILVSAEALLCRHGGKFTLGDVASSARVSMASIYSRYPSKDHLVREVQVRVLDGLTAQIAADLAQIGDEAGDLEWRTTRVTDVYAEAHLSRASIIRAFHSVAREDLALRLKGIETAQELVRLGTGAVIGSETLGLTQAAEERLRMIVQTLQHAVSSYLGFGHGAADPDSDWLAFKAAASRMVFLAAREALEQA